MGMKIPYGEVDFKKIRTEGYIYIDKITAKVQEFLFHCSVRDKEHFNEMNCL